MAKNSHGSKDGKWTDTNVLEPPGFSDYRDKNCGNLARARELGLMDQDPPSGADSNNLVKVAREGFDELALLHRHQATAFDDLPEV